MHVTRTENEESDSATIQTLQPVVTNDPQMNRHTAHDIESEVSGEIESLVRTLKAENKKKPLRFGIAVATIVAIMILVQSLLNHYLHVNIQIFVNMWVVWVGLAAAFAPTRLQKATARKLATFDDIRAVGPLAEALDRQDRPTQAAASSAIARLLPRMKASDSALLNDRQRDYLLTGLKKGSRDLKLAVLKALPQIGDERFLKEVTALSESRGCAKRDTGLRDAAKDAVVLLKQIIEADRIRMTLLRPAEAMGPADNHLLRPAGSAGGDDSLLLQPSDSPAIPIESPPAKGYS